MATASVRPRQPGAIHYLRILCARRTRHFDRPPAAVNLIDLLIPGTSAVFLQLICRSARFPFRNPQTELFGFGSGDTVFRITAGLRHYVVKIQRVSLGQTMDTLLRMARRRRDRLERVADIYRGEFDFFPPTQFVILNGPVLGRPAVATIQPLVEGEKRDLINSVSELELQHLLTANDLLRRQLEWFVERTLVALDVSPIAVDLGKDNLMLVRHEGKTRIVLTDTGMVDVDWLKQTGRYELYRDTMLRLQQALHQNLIAGAL